MTLDQLRTVPRSDLPALASNIRSFLIDSISKTGGHIGANLGAIELTIALHYAFLSPNDAIIYDTGHIGYAHKILTGRLEGFKTLNSYGGMSRFISRHESEHDFVEASHAGTSISLALGRALSMRNRGLCHWTIAFIGDGSLSEGLALEALNHASVEKNIRLLIVLNDNGFAISRGFGAIHNHLQTRLIGSREPDPLFTSLGYKTIGPVDGHNINALLDAIDEAKSSSKVSLLHAKTEKGRGLCPAAKHPFKMHFSFPFDPTTGFAKESSMQPAYQDIAAKAILTQMEKDPNIAAITPSTLYATGLADVFSKFPDRCFDPGMEEQHALTMAVGLALSGTRPVIFYQSTFLQRAFDQMIHDVCFSDQDILILAVRSGFAGYDNPTHHGIYDLSYMRCLPNLTIYYPRNGKELFDMVTSGLTNQKNGPTLILMPYGPADTTDFQKNKTIININKPELLRSGNDGIVLAVGNKVAACEKALDILKAQGLSFGLVNLRRIKPLPEAELLELINNFPQVVTVEEGVLEGGIGASVSSFMHRYRLNSSLIQIGLPCAFIEAGSNEELSEKYKLDAAGIASQIIADRRKK